MDSDASIRSGAAQAARSLTSDKDFEPALATAARRLAMKAVSVVESWKHTQLFKVKSKKCKR